MALIKRRTEPPYIRRLRQKFLRQAEYSNIKPYWNDCRVPFSIVLFSAILEDGEPVEELAEEINNDIDSLEKYYTKKLVYEAAIPPGYEAHLYIDRPEIVPPHGVRPERATPARLVYHINYKKDNSENPLPANLDSTKLKVDKILFSRHDQAESSRIDLDVAIDIISGLCDLALEALDLGAKNNPGYLMLIDRLSLQPFSDESEIARQCAELKQECIDVLRAMPTTKRFADNWHLNHRIYLDTEKIARKINKKINKVTESLNHNYIFRNSWSRTGFATPSMLIPQNILFKAKSKIKNTQSAYITRAGKRGYRTYSHAGSGDALAHGMILADDIVFYTPEELSAVIRGQHIEHFAHVLSSLAWLTKCILRKYTRNELTDRGDQKQHVIARLLAFLDTLGVPNWKKQKVLDGAFAKYEPLIKRDALIENLKGVSPALRKFVNKVGMPIDLENTYDPTAEKQIAKRLRDLSKALSAKYSVDYASNAGDVVLAAMRKAEDLDEIMLDVSAALEDCINYINAAADPS